jgi:hypothetical protein
MGISGHLQDRRLFLGTIIGTACYLPFSGIAHAKGLGLSTLLGKASDSALDRLALPGAFYNDPDIRIGLPLVGGASRKLGALSSILRTGKKTGLFDGLTRKMNDAAGVAAGEAKPIFRSAIDGLTLNDVPSLVSKKDGATQYLRKSSDVELQGKLRPLVDTALGDHGVYDEVDALNRKQNLLTLAGINRDGLGKWVTEKGLDGIFKYIGAEEAALRANPLGKANGFLKDILKD